MHAHHIAILDDVMTTGSTAHELAYVLKKAGVSRVDVWVCARLDFKSQQEGNLFIAPCGFSLGALPIFADHATPGKNIRSKRGDQVFQRVGRSLHPVCYNWRIEQLHDFREGICPNDAPNVLVPVQSGSKQQ